MKPQSLEAVKQQYRIAHSYSDLSSGTPVMRVSHPALEQAALGEIAEARQIMLLIAKAKSVEQARELATTFLSLYTADRRS